MILLLLRRSDEHSILIIRSVNRFLERVSRGVLHDACEQTYFEVRVEWIHLNQEAQILFSRPIEEREFARKHGGEVMSYITALPFDRETCITSTCAFTLIYFSPCV